MRSHCFPSIDQQKCIHDSISILLTIRSSQKLSIPIQMSSFICEKVKNHHSISLIACTCVRSLHKNRQQKKQNETRFTWNRMHCTATTKKDYKRMIKCRAFTSIHFFLVSIGLHYLFALCFVLFSCRSVSDMGRVRSHFSTPHFAHTHQWIAHILVAVDGTLFVVFSIFMIFFLFRCWIAMTRSPNVEHSIKRSGVLSCWFSLK